MTDAETVFNRYDIRGTYPDEISAAFAERFGQAVGTYARREHAGNVVIGRDTRDASSAVIDAFRDGVLAAGADVVDVGAGTTDRTALAARHYGGVGVMVTASHHAWERTGFKLLYRDGYGFSNEDMDAVKQVYRDGAFDSGDGTLLRSQHEFDEYYIDAVQDAFKEYADTIDGTILVDAIGGTERTAPLILEELGAAVEDVSWSERPSPEPGTDTREAVIRRVTERQDIDLAVGYDPDGDRVYAVHPDLGWIDGDRLFYLLATITEPDRIVASVDTAPYIETLDATVTYTRVGDIFVAAEGFEQDADLLGEPNGHYAVTDFCWYNSGILAATLLAAHATDLPAMLEPVSQYRTDRRSRTYDDTAARDAAMQQVMKRVAQAYEVVSTADGVKFDTGDATGLVRPSGTSPKIRLVLHYDTDTEQAVDDIVRTVFDD